MTPLPPWVQPNQLLVIRRLLAAFDAHGVRYQASGGLAGNLWGSLWPLHDIDLDVPNQALDMLLRSFREYVVYRGRLKDEEFDLEILQLRIEGVDVDISGADDARVRSGTGEWCSLANTIDGAVVRHVADVALRTQQLGELIKYKRILGRSQDLEDLASLALRIDRSG